jgi:putative membrane protein
MLFSLLLTKKGRIFMMQKEKNKQSFLKRHFKGIATAAIVTIPTIYTTFFLGSMWDPYGNISDLPVAVVNLDKSVEYEGSTMAVGDELVENLKDSDDLNFNFVDASEAQEGIEDGTYYMVITIPEDFSANATTLMDDEPEKMQLRYTTNPGTNYIASKMSESAMEKLKNKVSATVTKQYAQSVFDQISDAGDGMEEAADGAKQIYDGSVEISDGNTEITDNLDVLSDSTLTFVDGATSLEVGLAEYTSGVSTVNSGAKELSDGIDELSDGSASLSSGAEKLSSGAQKVSNGVDSYTDGVSQAYSGSAQLTQNSSALNQGAAALDNGLAQLYDGSDSLTQGVQQLSDSLSTSLSSETTSQIEQVSQGLTQLNDGIQQLNTAVSSQSFDSLGNLQTVLTQSLTSIGTSAQDAGAQLQTLQYALNSMVATEAFQSLDAATQQELLSAFSTPLQSIAADVQNIGSEVTSLSNSLSGLDTSSLSELQSSVETIAANSNILLPGANSAITSLSSGMAQVQTAVDTGILPGAQALESGIVQLQSGSSSLSSGIYSYTSGVAQLNSGLSELNDNSSTLSDGASQVSDGMDSLTDSIPQLTNGISKLQTGAHSLSDGTQELTNNNSTLLSGASQLTSGASQIQSGASKLASGSHELEAGLLSLTDGSLELSDSLSDGAETITSIDATDLTTDMFSSPIESVETKQTEVPNNGHAMAAYMMAVGLWVGCLAYCIMFSPKEERLRGKNGARVFAKKAPVLWLIAIIQAMLMVLLLNVFNGFTPKRFFMTVLVAVLSSIAFMSIVYCLNVYFGKVGSFILLVFMVLQLSGSAGTYPSELSASFFRIIKPFMPFTYTVHAFRSTIASGLSIKTDCMVFIGLTIVFSILSMIGLQINLKHQEEDSLYSGIHSESAKLCTE